jgi:hypothetical protein
MPKNNINNFLFLHIPFNSTYTSDSSQSSAETEEFTQGILEDLLGFKSFDSVIVLFNVEIASQVQKDWSVRWV